MVTAVSCAQVPKFTRDHRRQLRRRQLRHVRPRVRPALPVDVAQRAHLGDGRRAGRDGARDGPPRRDRGEGRRVERRRRGGVQGADPRAIRARGPSVLTRARGSGTTASSIRRTRGACWASRSRRRSTGRSSRRSSASSECESEQWPEENPVRTREARSRAHPRSGRPLRHDRRRRARTRSPSSTLARPERAQRVRRDADRRADAGARARSTATPACAPSCCSATARASAPAPTSTG